MAVPPVAPARADHAGPGDPLLPRGRRRPPGLCGPRQRAAARRRVVLAQPPPVRLAEPGLAPLPRRARRARDASSATTSAASGCPTGTSTTSRIEARLGDLEAILAATGFEQFALLGMSGGSAVAMAYAAAHPERVSRLILYGTVCGEPVAWSPDGPGRGGDLPEHDPGRLGEEDPDFRRVFTTAVHPRRDRGADALVRRPPADVDLARERRRQPDRPPGGRHRRGLAADHRPDRSSSRRSATGRRRSTTPVRGVVADPGRPARPAREPQPHPARRRTGVAACSSTRCRRSSSRIVGRSRPRAPSGRATGATVGARASTSSASPPTAGPTTRSPAALALSVADGRAPPVEHLREARAGRPGGPRRGRRGVPPARPRLTRDRRP